MFGWWVDGTIMLTLFCIQIFLIDLLIYIVLNNAIWFVRFCVQVPSTKNFFFFTTNINISVKII